ncbi:MAG: FIG027190: Putative transmembrane protein, partial [uncultured Rubrobacteraceae bacterium]
EAGGRPRLLVRTPGGIWVRRLPRRVVPKGRGLRRGGAGPFPRPLRGGCRRRARRLARGRARSGGARDRARPVLPQHFPGRPQDVRGGREGARDRPLRGREGAGPGAAPAGAVVSLHAVHAQRGHGGPAPRPRPLPGSRHGRRGGPDALRRGPRRDRRALRALPTPQRHPRSRDHARRGGVPAGPGLVVL